MAKNNRHGKAQILSDDFRQKIKAQLPTARDRLLFAIAEYTGERWGAIIQLEVRYVYRDAKNSVPHEFITFPACSRKGKLDTRQVFIHPSLKEILQAYQPPTEGWLFPSPRNKEEHLDFSTVDKMLRKACDDAGLGDAGISTHSTRRTFITRLHEQGSDIHTIQQITGHRSITALAGYIESNHDRIKQAISCLII